MSDPIVVKQIVLKPGHVPTGKTRHYRGGGNPIPPPSILRIVRLENAPGFYLYYCDEHGREMTDTWHETLEAATAQAEWEFCVRPDDWDDVRG